MIAGYLLPEQEDALQRMRERGTVRKHICQDEHQDHQRPVVSATPNPPRGKRALKAPKLPAPPRVEPPALWESTRPIYRLDRRRTRRVDGGSETASIRAVLRTAPPEGMLAREIEDRAGTGEKTVILIAGMRDVEVNRSPGRFRFRYRLAAPRAVTSGTQIQTSAKRCAAQLTKRLR